MALPGWVNYGEAERSAAVMAREMSGASASWAELLAHAQAVLANRTDTRDSEYLSTYDFDQWRDLISAARILDLASTEKGSGILKLGGHRPFCRHVLLECLEPPYQERP